MAEQPGDGPPNKRQKVGAPDTPTDNAEQSRGSLVQQGTGLAQPLLLNDPEGVTLRQRQLVFLLHAQNCQERKQERKQKAKAWNGAVKPCKLLHCETTKVFLNHMTTCTAGKSCQVPDCASSRQIISHWKICLRQDCPVCEPLKHTFDDRRGLERAYKALGLTLVNGEPRLQQFDNKSFSETSATATSNRGPKEWHQHVTPHLRNHLVHTFITAIFPNALRYPATLRDWRVDNLVSFARQIEGDRYETANSREEYYHLLAEKLQKVLKELEEKGLCRTLMQQPIGSLPIGGGQVSEASKTT